MNKKQTLHFQPAAFVSVICACGYALHEVGRGAEARFNERWQQHLRYCRAAAAFPHTPDVPISEP